MAKIDFYWLVTVSSDSLSDKRDIQDSICKNFELNISANEINEEF